MAYRIDYFKEGELTASATWTGHFDEAIQVAESGLALHQADFYRVIDLDGSNAEVASGRTDAQGP